MQPQVNDEGAVPVGVPGPLVLLHLRPWNSNFFSTQLMLPGTVPSLQIQKCPGRMLASSSVDHTSRACTHPHGPGLALFSSSTSPILVEGLEEVKGLLKKGTPMSWLQETLEEELWEEEQFQQGHTPPPPGLQLVWDQLSPLLQGQQRPASGRTIRD